MSEQGIGFLEADGLRVAVRYTIHITTRAGVKVVSGHATAVDAHVMFRFVTGGGEATLILENGRRWDCVVENGMGILTNRSENPPFVAE